MNKQLFVWFVLAIFTLKATAQTATIKGNVKDIKTGDALIGASVYIPGTTIGTVTDFDGNFILQKVPEGTINLACSFISYQTVTKKNIGVSHVKTTIINFTMAESTVALNDVKVVAKAKRESEVVLLIDQKKSVKIKQSIGAQELAAQGVSDAATATTKISGVSKQNETKGLNIRGLGDRYNSTTLNGLPLPSNNAEFKNIDLELFSTDIVSFIDVEKVSGAYLYGDFAGANVNIVSKTHNGLPFFKIATKTGYNSSLTKADNFYLGDGAGLLGFNNTTVPTTLKTYSFKNSWNPQKKNVYPFTGLSLSGGKTFDVDDAKINVFGSLSFDNEYEYSKLIQRAVNGSDFVRKDLFGEVYKYGTQTTGLLNVNYAWKNNNIYWNSVFLNTSDQQLKNFNANTIIDLADDGGLVRRMTFERNTVWVNQLLGEVNLTPKTAIKWGVAYNSVKNIVPDRRHLTMKDNDSSTVDKKLFATNDQANNNRYFHTLNENEVAINVSGNYKFGEGFADADYRAKITVGYNGKFKDRSFEATQFNHKIVQNYLTNVNRIDSYFNNANLQNNVFQLKVLSNDFITFSTYTGKQVINAGFVDFEYNISDKLLILAGLRAENVYQKITYNTVISKGNNDFKHLKILPSISIRYALNNKSNLRFASGITYTLPQFKETAPFIFEGITDVSIGNPYITPSTNYNGELKWEFFPKGSELFSVAVFGKYIKNPINRFVRASAGNEFTYGNTGNWAYLYGVELETKKEIWQQRNSKRIKKLYVGANLTLMKTNQQLNNDKLKNETEGKYTANFNKNKEQLQGTAPWIANANINYKYSWNEAKNSITSALVYRYESDRMYLLGYASLGNQVDKALHHLDFVVKSKWNKFGVNLSVKNILNQDIDRYQENASRNFLVKSYKKGVKFGLGLSYKF